MAYSGTDRGRQRSLGADQIESLVSELIRTLRGDDFSQRALSEALGYASNVVHTWESGRRSPSVKQAMAIVNCTCDDPVALDEASRLMAEAELTSDIRSATDYIVVDTLAAELNVSPRTIHRWRAGTTTPDFPQYLQMLEFTAGTALDYIATFVCPHELPSVSHAWTQRQDMRTLLATIPLASRVIAMLELDSYLSSEVPSREWLAQTLECSTSEVAFVLNRLEDVGLVRWKNGRLQSQLSPIDLIGTLRWHGTTPQIHAPVSPAAQRELRRATQDFFARIARIWSTDKSSKTEVACVTVASDFETPV